MIIGGIDGRRRQASGNRSILIWALILAGGMQLAVCRIDARRRIDAMRKINTRQQD